MRSGVIATSWVAELFELAFDASQLTELSVAVRSPASPVKDQDARFLAGVFEQVDDFALDGAHASLKGWSCRPGVV